MMKLSTKYLSTIMFMCVTVHSCIYAMLVNQAQSEMNARQTEIILRQKQCDDLIIILDRAVETLNRDRVAMATTLLTALQEKIAPIIVSSNIMRNFCSWKEANKEEFDAIKLNALKEKIIPTISPVSLAISATDFNESDWYCYAATLYHGDLILLMPKNYLAKHALPSSHSNLNDQIKECGFNTDNMEQIPHPSTKTMLNYIEEGGEKKWNDYKKKLPRPSLNSILKSMFMKKGSYITRGWNIYITGHGNPTDYRNLQEISSNVPSFIDQTLTTPFNVQTSKEEKPGDIAGMPSTDFIDFMDFLNTEILTLFVHYMTCYSGGYHQLLLNALLQKLNVNFITSSEGINESHTQIWMPPIAFNHNKTDLTLAHSKFTPFFNLLNTFFGEPTTFSSTRKSLAILEKDPIAAIIKSLIDPNLLTQNQPLVRIPAVGIFSALTVDKKVKIITNTIVKAHEFENEPLNLTDPNIEIIIMYPDHIRVPLHINAHTSFISPQQITIPVKTQSIHIFEHIVTDGSLSSLIGHLIWLNSNPGETIFVIKKLTCLDTENSGFKINNEQLTNIENLILQLNGTSPKGEQHAVKIAATSYFTFNQQNYLYKLNKYITVNNRIEFYNMYQPPHVAAPQIINTDLQQMVKQFEKRINKPTVQNIGSLKTALLKNLNIQKNDALRKKLEKEKNKALKKLEKENDYIHKNTTSKKSNWGVTISTQQIEPKVTPFHSALQPAAQPPIQQGILARLYNWWYGKK